MIVRWGLDLLPGACAEAGVSSPLLVASPRWDALELRLGSVTHWRDVAEDEYWNEEHFPGASLTIDTLAAAPDQRASALTFLRRGRELLRGP